MAHRRATERHREDARRQGKDATPKEEHRKASVRAKVEHPFRVIRRQFGLLKA